MDRRWLLVAGVGLLSVVSGVWLGRGVRAPAPPPIPSTATTTAVSPAADTILVHVAGWVVSPGVVEVAPAGRVGDAVAAAGGARPGARLDAVNLAAPLVDGQQVTVPGPDGAVPSASGGGSGSGGSPELIRLNSATAADLEALPGVGPVLAERIVAHREARGAFERVEDLLEVPGIGESKLASIRELVTVP